MTDQFWKIGELAEQTGLTVRTLHYYDEQGLLSPSYRTNGGHRLYTASDVARLQQIISLKSLGFTIEQIKDALTKPEFSPGKVLEMHMEKITQQLKLQEDLKMRIEGMQRFIKNRGTLTAEEFLTTIKLMQEVDEMYSEEEMETIKAQGRKLGTEKIVEAEEEWPQLMASMKAQMDGGALPSDPKTLRLARRWKELVEMFTGGNPEIGAKLNKMYRENPDAGKTFGGPGFDAALFTYVGEAMKKLPH